MQRINFEAGEKFPTDEIMKRNRDILENHKLYKGCQTEVYLPAFLARLELAGVTHTIGDRDYSIYDDVIKNKYEDVLQGVNVTAPICDFYADLLFGVGIEITADKNEDWISEWMESVDLGAKLHAAQKGSGYRGDAVIKVWENTEGKAKIAAIPAEYWIPITSLEDRCSIEKDAIVHQIELDSNQRKLYRNKTGEKSVLRVIIYEKGQNTYKAFLKVDGKLGEQIAWDENRLGELPNNAVLQDDELTYIEETGYDYSMIQRVPNKADDNEVFGLPFITKSFKEQERELCIRATQRGRVLDKNADPGMEGPSQRSETNPVTGAKNVKVNGKYIEREQDDVETRYITWQGDLLESRESEKLAMQYIYQETGTNAAALAASTEGLNIISGTAFEKVLMRPLSIANNLKMNWKPIINRIIKLAHQIEKGGDIQPDVRFEDGLPKSYKQQLEETKLANGGEPVISQKTGIKRANPTYTEEQVIEEFEEILDETQRRESFVPLVGETEFGEE